MTETPIVVVDDVADDVAKAQAIIKEQVNVEEAKLLATDRARALEQLPPGYEKRPDHRFVNSREPGCCLLCGVKWSEHFHTLGDVEHAFARMEKKEWKRLPFHQRQHYNRMAREWLAQRGAA